MWIYRVKQFYWAITAVVNTEDKIFVRKHLTTEERNLFKKLPVFEQKHCINVAKEIEEQSEKQLITLDKLSLIRVALLHDIGKIEYPLNPIEKSIMVLLHKVSKGYIKKYVRFKIIYTYYYHGEIGYNILKEKGYDKTFLALIRNHHNETVHWKELELLKQCDNKH